MLEELDKLRLASIFAGDRLKKFHLWQQFKLDNAPDLGEKEIPTFNNFFASNNNSDLSNTSPKFSDALDDFDF